MNTVFNRTKILLVLFTALLFITSCGGEADKGSPEYITEIKDWHQAREARLVEDTGWLNLVGLYWLDEGENSFGTAESNDVIFPKGLEQMGTFTLGDSAVTFKAAEGVTITSNGEQVTEMELKPDISGERTILEWGTLRWFVIVRSGDNTGAKYGIRLRDLEADAVKNFAGVDMYPIDEDWKIEAEYVKYDEPKPIVIPSIIGTKNEDESPGELVFTIDGEEYKLNPLDMGDGFWLIFADMTSGKETYGAGRFLYTEGPGENNKVIIDFNKAYNPPCAFSKYATCPLPPKENHLKVEITAGEKNYGDHH